MKLCCPLLPTPQKLSMHSLLAAGTLAEPENTTALQKKGAWALLQQHGPMCLFLSHRLTWGRKYCGSVFRRPGKASSPAFPFQLTACRHFTVRTSHPPSHPALGSCQPHPLHQGEVLLTFPVSYPVLGCGQDAACSCVLGCLLGILWHHWENKNHRFGIIRKWIDITQAKVHEDKEPRHMQEGLSLLKHHCCQALAACLWASWKGSSA